MQLQYVLANPRQKNSRKKKKARSRVHKKHKSSQTIKVGGNPVKKGKLKKGSAAAKAWGRKMKKARLAKGNPKKSRKKRKNPYRDVATVPVHKTLKSKKYYSPDELKEFVAAYRATAIDKRNVLNSLSDRELAQAAFLGNKKIKTQYQKLDKETKKEKAAVKKILDAQREHDKFQKKVADSSGKITLTEFLKNPKGRKMKRKKKSKKAKRNAATAKLVQVNPRKKRKSRKTRKSRRKARSTHSKAKKSKNLVRMVGRARLSKKAAKAIGRRRKLGVTVAIKNPIMGLDWKDLGMASLWAAGGYAAAQGIVFAIDSLAKGKATAAIRDAAGPMGAPFVIPALGVLGGIGLMAGSKYIPGKGGNIAQKMGAGAITVGGILVAAAAVRLVLGQAIKQFPQIATLPVIGPAIQASAMAGVEFFPMSGADFGRMGDGYKQQPGDWGTATVGGIPSGMGDVQFFPMQGIPSGMGEVQYYPRGSNGDDMFTQSEAGDLLEAEGLGNADFGSADFGEIPSGMGMG